MCKALLPLVLLFVGCAPAHQDLRPFVAVSMKYCAMERATPPEAPPAPTPENRTPCKACGGDGVLGDGRIAVQCGKCEGKGYTICKDGTCPTNATAR